MHAEPGRPDRYTGQVLVERMLQAADDSVRVYRVHFAPGSRTVWHVHHREQVLVGLTGVCLVSWEDGRVRRLGPGEMVSVSAGARHWHGAGPDGPGSHLALNYHGPTDWQSAVTEESYQRAGASNPR